MKAYRNVLLILATLLLALALSMVALAEPPTPSSGVTLAGTVASKISYQGRLTDASGNPLNGTYNLVFQLWDDATAGSQVGSDIVRNSVPVSNGLFTVDLDVPQSAFNGQALWLRIQVNGQWLSPRQELLPVPYALSLRPGAWINGNSTDAAITVTNAGLLGTAIKVNGAGVGLDVLGATGIYVQGWGLGIDAYGMTGVRGQGDIGVQGLGLIGVRGTSDTGYGVMGVTNAPMTATAAAGVYGESFSGHGVEGKSQFDVGVYGQSSGGFGAGVGGSGVTGVFGSGGLVGVSGYTTNDNTTGVLGTATGTSAKGVEGIADNYGSIGVHGSGGFGTGVQGNGEIGVKGVGSVGTGVWGEGPTGVEGTSQSGAGVWGTSTSGYGVMGNSVNGPGGYFTSTNSTGVIALGYEGLHAEATSNIGYGVHGMGVQGAGVHGDSTQGYGVSGSGQLGGVFGTSNFGAGVEGRVESGSAILGVSTHGDGIVGNSVTGVGVYGNTGSGMAAVMGEGPKGVYGKSSADGGEGVTGEGLGQLTEGVLGSSAYAHGVGGYSSGTNGGLAIGVYGQTNATWGLATNQKVYAGGGCVGCTVAFVGQNGDDSPLEVGDVVAISGIAPPLQGQQTPVLQVRRATMSDGGALGVVQARVVVTATKTPVLGGDSDQTTTTEMPGLAPGNVAPGDYLFVVVQGLVQARANADLGAIAVGDALGPGATAGLVQKLSQDTTAAPVLGRALEPLAGGAGLIWVLVLGR